MSFWPEHQVHQPWPLKREARTSSQGMLLEGSALCAARRRCNSARPAVERCSETGVSSVMLSQISSTSWIRSEMGSSLKLEIGEFMSQAYINRCRICVLMPHAPAAAQRFGLWLLIKSGRHKCYSSWICSQSFICPKNMQFFGQIDLPVSRSHQRFWRIDPLGRFAFVLHRSSVRNFARTSSTGASADSPALISASRRAATASHAASRTRLGA